MSASHRASALLFALLLTIVLFAVFVAATSLSFLSKHSYALDYGWNTKPDQELEACYPPFKSKGFPLKTWRQDPGPISGCLESTNPLAKDLDLALCFAFAAIISVGAASVIKNT